MKATLLICHGCIAIACAHDHPSHAATKKSPIDREIAKLEVLVKRPGGGPEAWVALGNARMQKTRDRIIHDFADAEAAFKKALEIKADDAPALTGMAWVKNSEHDFTAGKAWAEKALAADPMQTDAHALIGDGAVELGDYELAYEHYRKALRQRADLSSLSRMAHLLWTTGDAAHAKVLMQQAIDAGGPYAENAAWCRAELALMQFHSGAMLPAEQQAAQAMAAAPENPRVLAAMARILAAKKDYTRAIELYGKSAAITPNHDALAGLALTYRVSGQEEKAKQYFDRVVAFHAAHVHQHDGGEAHSHSHPSGNAQLARFLADHDKDLETALKEAQASYEGYKNVGSIDTYAWCLHKAGKNEEALRMIRNARRWNTPDAEILFHAGMIHHALKQTEAARQCFAKALSKNPSFHPIHAPMAAGMLAKANESLVKTDATADPAAAKP
jgi:tetratricopeptide (TPR) repeat protein